MKRISYLTLLMSYFIFAIPSWSIDELHPFYEGVRAKGMGGVQVATVNDETALVINPSALGKLRDVYGTVIDPDIDFSTNYLKLLQSSSLTDTTNLEKVKTALTNNTDTYYSYNQQLLPSFVARNFGIGILMKKTLNAYMDTNATNMETFFRDDMGLILGYNLRFFDGYIKIGVAGKLLSRIELNKVLSTSTNSFDLKTLASQGHVKEGLGVGYDVGISMTGPVAMLPTLSAVVHDVGGMSFTTQKGVRMTSTDTPTLQKQDVDVGISFSPIHGKNIRSTWAAEYRYLLTASDINDSSKLLHLGAEFNISDLVFLRAGYYQKHWTAGFEFASEHYQLQFATYGAEVGTADSPFEDRRYNLKFAWRY